MAHVERPRGLRGGAAVRARRRPHRCHHADPGQPLPAAELGHACADRSRSPRRWSAGNAGRPCGCGAVPRSRRAPSRCRPCCAFATPDRANGESVAMDAAAPGRWLSKIDTAATRARPGWPVHSSQRPISHWNQRAVTFYRACWRDHCLRSGRNSGRPFVDACHRTCRPKIKEPPMSAFAPASSPPRRDLWSGRGGHRPRQPDQRRLRNRNGGRPSSPTPTGRCSTSRRYPAGETTATDNQIEIWGNNFSSVSGGPVPAYEGAPVRRDQRHPVRHPVPGRVRHATGSVVGFEFAHRGRSGWTRCA